MAEMVQEKSTGLKFAEEQLLRHGWEKGKGLGKSENGISEAIKVKIKCGRGGMGHKEGEQFSFHWWDHVFNKASSSLVVETGQSGVIVKSDDCSDGLISIKKPRKPLEAKSMLYGSFVKSATLLSGEEQPEKTSVSDDSSSSEDEDQKLDLSSTTKLSDSDLLKACGGRTAHKGARHGLTMSAKLARLEQQEQEFVNKYGKKNNTAKTSTSSTDCQNSVGNPDIKEKTRRKKSKIQVGPSANNIHEDKMTTQVILSNDIEDGKPKKRKDSNDVSVNDDDITDIEPKKKKKKNRKEKVLEDGLNGECSVDVNEAFTHTSEERDTHLQMNDSIHKKKKKKRSKVAVESAYTDEISEDSTDAHGKQPQEGSIDYQQTNDNASKKKKKSALNLSKTSPSTDVENSASVMTEDTSNKAQVMDTQTEGQENNRKKNKKKKQSKKEEQDVLMNVQFEESMPKKKKCKE